MAAESLSCGDTNAGKLYGGTIIINIIQFHTSKDVGFRQREWHGGGFCVGARGGGGLTRSVRCR